MVEGNVTRDGEKVLVRRGAVDQPFNKEQVRFVGNSKDDVYAFLLGKVKSDDPAARFKLARWCSHNGMREQALVEAREVVRLQPTNSSAAELARTLEESLRLFPTNGTPASGPTKPPSQTAPAAPGLPAVPPPPGVGGPSAVSAPVTPKPVVEPEPDIAPEAILAFAPRVQPVLANLCADCHARQDYKGEFKLANTTGQYADPSLTRHNLRVVSGQIKKSDPAASPLLVKSLTLHGDMKQPAIVSRHAPVFQLLEAWVHLATGTQYAPSTAPPPPPSAPASAPPAAQLPAPTAGGLPQADAKPVLPPADVKPVLPPSEPVSKPVLPPSESASRPMFPSTEPVSKPVLPTEPKPAMPSLPSPSLPSPNLPSPSLPPAATPTLPPPVIPPSDEGANPVVPFPAPPSIPAPPPIPPAANLGKFGQDAKPLPSASPPDPMNAGQAVDEFDPSLFNRTVPGQRPVDAPMSSKK